MFTLSFRAKHDLVHLITRSWFIFRFIMVRPCAITYFFCVYKLLSSQHKRACTQIQLNYSFGRYAVLFLYIRLGVIECSIQCQHGNFYFRNYYFRSIVRENTTWDVNVKYENCHFAQKNGTYSYSEQRARVLIWEKYVRNNFSDVRRKCNII